MLEGRVQFTTVQMEPRKPDRPKGTQQREGENWTQMKDTGLGEVETGWEGNRARLQST